MHDAQLDGAKIQVSIVLPRRRFSQTPPPARRGPPPGDRFQDDFDGGYGNNNKISIIDLSTDSLREEIIVGDKPLQLQKELNETIWVICS